MLVFDNLMNGLLEKFNVPGAALAISKNGRLVYAKGFGYADISSSEKVTTRSQFRIASVSKPIAAVAILKLVEQGKLKLTDNPYTILGDMPLPKGKKINPDIYKITILDLLRHTGGQALYNSTGRIMSPMQPPVSREISKAFNIPHPPPTKFVIGYMQSQRLINQPGQEFRYSNYGYLLLGAVVSKVTGMDFESYVRHQILSPLDIQCIKFGHTLRSQKAVNEVSYYDLDNAKRVASVFDGELPDYFPYAGRHQKGWGASGAWIASPVDIVKFVNHVDGLKKPSILRKSSVVRMLKRQTMTGKKPNFWYGLGWRVQKKKIGQHWYHNGASNLGSAAIMLRTSDGTVWSAQFNKRLPRGRALYKEFNKEMWRLIRGIKSWPSHDLFNANKCNERL